MASVLIVDDSSFMRVLLKEMIEQTGHEVAGEAENGLEAVSMYIRLRPDIVTMNIVMPELFGIEAVRRIRQVDPRAKVIICSAMGNSYNVVEAIQAGALDFIVKPFDAARLGESIKRLMNRL
ncbi:response regulator [Paenibacillus chartarius]|uniref:Response regulator n=1 Tax=Paenibacillus chartarius TaxID=747481 RepID=A0ABV6DMX4_9BACL